MSLSWLVWSVLAATGGLVWGLLILVLLARALVLIACLVIPGDESYLDD